MVKDLLILKYMIRGKKVVKFLYSILGIHRICFAGLGFQWSLKAMGLTGFLDMKEVLK